MSRKKKTPSEAQRIHNAIVGRLLAYRRYVGMMAGGRQLRTSEEDDLAEVSDRLNVPCWAIPRDVRAAIAWQTAGGADRARLLHEHSRLFEDADAWAVEFFEHNGRNGILEAPAINGEPEAL